MAEAAVVPSPDPLRLAVPKAYVVLAKGFEPSADTARSILEYCREHLPAYKRVRRLEFARVNLPTASTNSAHVSAHLPAEAAAMKRSAHGPLSANSH